MSRKEVSGGIWCEGYGWLALYISQMGDWYISIYVYLGLWDLEKILGV